MKKILISLLFLLISFSPVQALTQEQIENLIGKEVFQEIEEAALEQVEQVISIAPEKQIETLSDEVQQKIQDRQDTAKKEIEKAIEEVEEQIQISLPQSLETQKAQIKKELEKIPLQTSSGQEHLIAVAQAFSQLLVSTPSAQVSQTVIAIAQTQPQNQNQIQAQLIQIESRPGYLKIFIGPNFQALHALKLQITQNQLSIQELEQLKNQLTSNDQTLIQTTITALKFQNTALQEQITQEENSFSLFGWLFKLFTP